LGRDGREGRGDSRGRQNKSRSNSNERPDSRLKESKEPAPEPNVEAKAESNPNIETSEQAPKADIKNKDDGSKKDGVEV